MSLDLNPWASLMDRFGMGEPHAQLIAFGKGPKTHTQTLMSVLLRKPMEKCFLKLKNDMEYKNIFLLAKNSENQHSEKVNVQEL